MGSSRVALEVDGDQVTFVELSGDLAVSSATVNAGTLRDSMQTVLRGFRQRRSDPPVAVALVVPGFRFERVEVSADDVRDPSRVLERLDPSGADRVAIALPDAPAAGTVASGFGLVAPSDLVDAVSEALGPIRHEVFVSAACLPVDGVFVGLHMSSTTLTVLSGGRPLLLREMDAGGLGRVAAAVSPGDTQAGLAMVSEALGGGGSVVVAAEISRHLRGVFRAAAAEISAMVESGRLSAADLEVCPFGVGAQDMFVRDAAAESGLTVAVPQPVSDALLYLPVGRRLPALAALGSAVAPPPQLLPSGGFAAPSEPGARRRRLPAALLAAALLAAGASAYDAYDVTSRTEAARAELASFPPTVRAAQEIAELAARPPAPPWLRAVAELPAARISGLEVVGVEFDRPGRVAVVLAATGPSGLSSLRSAVVTLERLPGVSSVEVLGVSGGGERTLVELELEVEG